MSKQEFNLFLREYNGDFRRNFSPDRQIKLGRINPQNIPVEEKDGIKSLVLSRTTDSLLNG
jgi:hypothetical protein